MFLPQMAKANEELEKKIAGAGSESVVIDSTILAESSDEEEGNTEQETDSNTDSKNSAAMIKIDFALGDFDEHPIALAEEEKDGIINDSQGRSFGDAAVNEEGEESDNDESVSKNAAVTSMFRVDK